MEVQKSVKQSSKYDKSPMKQYRLSELPPNGLTDVCSAVSTGSNHDGFSSTSTGSNASDVTAQKENVVKRAPLIMIQDHTGEIDGYQVNASLITLRKRDAKRMKVVGPTDFNARLPETLDSENMVSSDNYTSMKMSDKMVIQLNEESCCQNDQNMQHEQNVYGVVHYPDPIQLPSSGMLKDFYEAALLTEEEEIGCKLISDFDVTKFDQIYLNEADILSFEKVFLPSISCQEEKALKQLQAKIQRDYPEQKPVLMQCRKFLFSCIRSATIAAEQSRHQRSKVDKLCEEQWVLEKERQIAEEKLRREEESKQKAEKRLQLRELRKLKAIRELKKTCPQNQENWKEVAYLMKELAHLQNDEERWNKELALLRTRKSEVNEEEKSLSELVQLKRTERERNRSEKNLNSHFTSEKTSLAENKIIQSLTQSIQEIILSSTRIEQGLGIVSAVLEETENTRKELFNEYTTYHQFKGYQGIRNPKALILALSQSQDDSEW